MGHVLGHKSPKGAVSVTNYNNRIRLRWRCQGKRYSFSLGPYDKINLKAAKRVVLQLELDMVNSGFDETLVKYGAKLKNPEPNLEKPTSKVGNFEHWVKNFLHMDCNVNIDYYNVRNMLVKWGEWDEHSILVKLNAETFGARTYNSRLAILKRFSSWMYKQAIWSVNPLIDVSTKQTKKTIKAERKPFTEEEIRFILDAIKTDIFCSPSSSYQHSFYYPFLYFIFKTGVRNAEAVGLRIGSLDFKNKTITNKEVLARTVKGTHAAARIRKETKNGKVRILPMTDDLEELLRPATVGKDADDLVFQSFSGGAIDDRMFQRRVFSVVLQKLNIEHRVLYACRHTFGSRCIESGINPVMTAFLMGNNAETALRNYTHQLSIPKELPNI
jgi:integrase